MELNYQQKILLAAEKISDESSKDGMKRGFDFYYKDGNLHINPWIGIESSFATRRDFSQIIVDAQGHAFSRDEERLNELEKKAKEMFD